MKGANGTTADKKVQRGVKAGMKGEKGAWGMKGAKTILN